MENKNLEQKLGKMKEELGKRNIMVIDDIIPGHPAYGFLDGSLGQNETLFLAAFYYQDHGRFSDEFLEPYREEGYKIENCEDLAKADTDPRTGYFYDSMPGKFIKSKYVKENYCCKSIKEEEFRTRTGIGNADGIIVMGRQPNENIKTRVFVHEGFHGLDIDCELPEIDTLSKKFGDYMKSMEIITDMRAIACIDDESEVKVGTCYIKGDNQTHDYIKKLLAGKGDLITENKKVLKVLYNQFSQDTAFQEFALNNLKKFSEMSDKENLESFKTALECLAFGKQLSPQKA